MAATGCTVRRHPHKSSGPVVGDWPPLRSHASRLLARARVLSGRCASCRPPSGPPPPPPPPRRRRRVATSYLPIRPFINQIYPRYSVTQVAAAAAGFVLLTNLIQTMKRAARCKSVLAYAVWRRSEGYWDRTEGVGRVRDGADRSANANKQVVVVSGGGLELGAMMNRGRRGVNATRD